MVKSIKATLEKNGKGRTEFTIDKVVRAPANWTPTPGLVMEKYVPVEPGLGNRFLVFCDLEKGQLDAYRGISLNSVEWEKYAIEAVRQNATDQVSHLLFFLKHLESPTREIAADAFLEFAKATDNALLAISRQIPLENLRQWLRDPKVPENRLGLYAFLLGAQGKPEDLNFLSSLLKDQSPRAQSSHDGILLALVRIHPELGWKTLQGVLGENETPLNLRLAGFRVLKGLFDGDASVQTRKNLHLVLQAALKQGELSDLVIEELRRQKDWALSAEILNRWGTKGFDTPIVKRAIIRYALTAPGNSSLAIFLQSLARQEPQLLSEVRESLLIPASR